MVRAYVINGLGIGCHEEVKHAFEVAGAEAEIIHIRRLLAGDVDLSQAQILNFAGGFLHGDMGGAGMYAANELEQSGIKDSLLEFVEDGGVIYGQCNGFQLLVKTGLLPGIGGDYSRQTVTLTNNDVDNYRVDFVHLRVEGKTNPFAFLEADKLAMWSRHGEGKIQFHTRFGSITEEEGERNRAAVNESHVLLRYVDPTNLEMPPTEEFPHNPNGSVDGIAGLVDTTGRIFGQMPHPEAGVYISRMPGYFGAKDALRRRENKPSHHAYGREVFRNIVRFFD